jgi:hypothetical protein
LLAPSDSNTVVPGEDIPAQFTKVMGKGRVWNQSFTGPQTSFFLAQKFLFTSWSFPLFHGFLQKWSHLFYCELPPYKSFYGFLLLLTCSTFKTCNFLHFLHSKFPPPPQILWQVYIGEQFLYWPG